MPTKVWKDGNRCTITEWDVRSIDKHGDAQDVNSYDSEAEARTFTDSYDLPEGEIVAVVIEKHIAKHPGHRFDKPDTYTVVATKGDTAALKAGGWID